MSPTENEDRGPPLRSFLIVMLVISILSIVLRFWSRAIMPSQSSTLKRNPRFWWDDWLALICLPFTVATTSMGLYLIHLGLGKHFNTIPPAQQTTVLKAFWATYFVYDTAITLAKSSVLFFYARIFSTASTKFRYTLWAGQAVVYLWLFGILMTVTFTCVPVQKSWQPEIKGHCQTTEATYLGSAISSVIIDLFILLLPLPILWRLQMKMLQRILITGVFVCGYCVIAISLGRLITIINAGPGLQDDLTWNVVTPVYWLGSEAPISILSICLPSIFFFVRRALSEGPSSLFTNRTHTSARLMSPNHRGTDHTHDNTSIELKDSQPDMPDLGDGQNYRAMASKGSDVESVSSRSHLGIFKPGIYVRNEIDVTDDYV